MVKDKKIFLDYGGLICDYQFNRRTLFRAHRLALDYLNSQNGHRISLDRLSQAHDKTIQAYLQARNRNNSEWTMDKIMEMILSDLGLNGNVHLSRVSDIYKYNDHDSEPYPDTERVLSELSKRRKLGIISNLPHDSEIEELRAFGLIDHFDSITLSYQVGFRKPHPAIYQEALRSAGVTPEQSFFISHDQEETEGAEKLGIESLLVKSIKEVIGAV
ncbi:MAG: HAD family hydrolase [Nanoarchaeota archaeon]|nr:HAD family hydrolase [Nanoarchaeota archaeon]